MHRMTDGWVKMKWMILAITLEGLENTAWYPGEQVVCVI